MANRITLRIFAIKQRIRSKNKQEMRGTMTATQLNANEVHPKSVYKWIMASGASKHMTSQWTAFHTYEIIIPYNVNLGDNNNVQVIEIDPLS